MSSDSYLIEIAEKHAICTSIDSFEFDFEGLKDFVASVTSGLARQHLQELRAYRLTVENLEKDAERYRWLRAAHDREDDSVSIFIGDEQHGSGHLDYQIDDAMYPSDEDDE